MLHRMVGWVVIFPGIRIIANYQPSLLSGHQVRKRSKVSEVHGHCVSSKGVRTVRVSTSFFAWTELGWNFTFVLLKGKELYTSRLKLNVAGRENPLHFVDMFRGGKKVDFQSAMCKGKQEGTVPIHHTCLTSRTLIKRRKEAIIQVLSSTFQQNKTPICCVCI